MENKINLIELLKDCPSGMELDCTMFENVSFRGIQNSTSEIMIHTPEGIKFLNSFGCYHDSYRAKCVIFPKGKTTWEGFEPPCKFKKGDVLVSVAGNIVLFSHIDSENRVYYHCIIPTYGGFRIEGNTKFGVGRYYECVLANEQQRQRMYDKIKCSWYKYNQQLNKLEKFVEPKFKIGDKIRKSGRSSVYEITYSDEGEYQLDDKDIHVPWDVQDEWELFPDKFDISSLITFESKVLVRDLKDTVWRPAIYGFYLRKVSQYYVVVGGFYWKYLIPYEGNEHLMGTTDDCDEFYKTWQ